MTNEITQADRELLAAEYEKGDALAAEVAASIRAGHTNRWEERALRAIAVARDDLPRQVLTWLYGNIADEVWQQTMNENCRPPKLLPEHEASAKTYWTDAQVGTAMAELHRALKEGKLPSEAWRIALTAAVRA